ncbi:MAG: antibiotic biosynthesis monooxygenase [Chitinophagales bacterium]|nr:antibiotic biosynthesis monooxygenase [Chitinophagales bacterium]
MLVRIVKLTFQPEKISYFIQAFNERKHLIAACEGCLGVELLRDINTPNIFLTYSKWDSVEHLENYRQSELFIETWAIVKQWFSDKPEAWSVENV